MRRSHKGKETEDQNFWQSYSDMMAALVLVFVLLTITLIISFKTTYEDADKLLTENEELTIQLEEYVNNLDLLNADLEEKIEELNLVNDDLDETKNELAIAKKDLDASNSELDEFKLNLAAVQALLDNSETARLAQKGQIDSIIGIRTDIIERLQEEFDNSSMNIIVDSETGTITFDSTLLFDTGSSTLKAEGQNFLKKFFPEYFKILTSDGVYEYIAEVIIEGHTDSRGSYLSNLKLSQDRAYAVAQFCLGEDSGMFTGNNLEIVRRLVTANGRSFTELKYKSNGQEDQDASRRVEVKFRLKEQEMMTAVSEILENEDE